MLAALRFVFGHAPLRIAAITIFFVGFTNAAILPYQSLIGIRQLGLSEQAFGALMFAAALFATLGQVVIGHFSDQARNRKQAVLLSMAAGALGYGLFWALPSVPAFVLCLLVVAPVASASYAQLYASVRAETLREGSGLVAAVNTVIRSIYAASWILVPGLVGAVVALTGQASDAFGLAALAYLACLLLYGLFGVGGGRAEAVAGGRVAGLLLAFRLVLSGRILRPMLALALIGVGHHVSNVLLPLIVTGELGGQETQIGLLAGLKAGLEIPFMLLGAAFVSRWPVVWLIALGGGLHIVYLLGLTQATAMPQIYGLTVLSAAGDAVLLALHIGYLQELLPDRPGLGTALFSVQSLMMKSLAAGIVAGVGLVFGQGGALVLAAVLVLGGTVGILWLDRR
ncbi:MFS transporter [Neogemmobacter tilapiae]|uniref:MFS transporter n=1 Tax=Neogemmobacter tilapiae TaxID=875041 RepID=A0A918TID1_9RHOB|nr:MFS transporter [Gemmobacter tilapiae]GHC47488.1 MFS transporter [Gemmobacter tilapiae]